jgi:16S rRNA (uracil1498-N3)-methyltransferase
MDYFYVSPGEIHGGIAVIRGDEFKHLIRVVRKKEGEQIVLLDGEDNSYRVIIRSIGKDHAECEILEKMQRLNEPAVEVTLAVSVLRNPARFDVLVEKATELGVRTIIPMVTERTIPKGEKHSRLEKIALAAMKQCGRAYCPNILPLAPFEDVLSRAGQFSLRLLPHEQSSVTTPINTVLGKYAGASSILVVVGPEGGFTEAEVAAAEQKGFLAVSLGPRRLRTETAAIAAVGWIVGNS